MRVEFALAAQHDLFAIEACIAADSPAGAARIVARVRAAVQRLADFPHIGRAGQKPGTYELVTVRPT